MRPEALQREVCGRAADHVIAHGCEARGVVQLTAGDARRQRCATAVDHALVVLVDLPHPDEAHAVRDDAVGRVGHQVDHHRRGRIGHAGGYWRGRAGDIADHDGRAGQHLVAHGGRAKLPAFVDVAAGTGGHRGVVAGHHRAVELAGLFVVGLVAAGAAAVVDHAHAQLFAGVVGRAAQRAECAGAVVCELVQGDQTRDAFLRALGGVHAAAVSGAGARGLHHRGAAVHEHAAAPAHARATRGATAVQLIQTVGELAHRLRDVGLRDLRGCALVILGVTLGAHFTAAGVGHFLRGDPFHADRPCRRCVRQIERDEAPCVGRRRGDDLRHRSDQRVIARQLRPGIRHERGSQIDGAAGVIDPPDTIAGQGAVGVGSDCAHRAAAGIADAQAARCHRALALQDEGILGGSHLGALAAAIGVGNALTPTDGDRAAHVGQFGQGHGHGAGGVGHGAHALPRQRACAVIRERVAVAEADPGDRDGARLGRRRQREHIGQAAVLLPDLDAAHVRRCRRCD